MSSLCLFLGFGGWDFREVSRGLVWVLGFGKLSHVRRNRDLWKFWVGWRKLAEFAKKRGREFLSKKMQSLDRIGAMYLLP